MNLKQLLNKYTKLHNEEYSLNENHVLDDLLEFEKELVPEVPQYVADWYEENKDNLELNLYRAINSVLGNFRDCELSKFEKWLVDGHTTPFQTLVNMHQFGYVISENKKYLVRMIGIISGDNYLNYDSKNKKWYFDNSINSKDVRSYHTRKDLNESGFGDVFNSSLFDVKEV